MDLTAVPTPAAVRGAFGFLTRLPVGRDAAAWDAFRRSPAAFPLVGYAVGAAVALPLVAPVPAPTAALGFVLAVYLATGINHLDGVADLGDAAVVHGSVADRRAVMKDTVTGVGALLALATVVVGLALAGLSLARAPNPVAVVVAAEVGAKLGMAALASFGSATHEGLGSALTEPATAREFVLPLLVALPLVALGAPAAVALLGALTGALAVFGWARANLGGVSGDVFGAANEFARVVGLHAGVIAWTLS